MTQYLTQEGLAEIQAELKDLKEVRLPEVLRALSSARSDGDLSENAAYDTAKALQDQIETRIAELEEVLADYELIEERKEGPANRVEIGTTVEIEYSSLDHKPNYTLKIVGSSEANAFKNTISVDSPLAHAIMGKGAGEVVKFKVKGKEMEAKILKITY